MKKRPSPDDYFLHSQISDNFEAAGAYMTGKITNEERLDIVRNSCPGPGESLLLQISQSSASRRH